MKFRVFMMGYLGVLLLSAAAGAQQYIAYSVREAQARMAAGNETGEVKEFAKITRLVGMVIDKEGKDVILVGIQEPGEKPLDLDDLVVGLRSRLVRHEWPLVSLDNTPETRANHLQRVRFEGGIADTELGKSLLDADVTLKQLALGKRSATSWGVKSYATLCDEAAARGNASPASVLFWFFPMNYTVCVQDGVFAIGNLAVGTKTQLLSPAGATDTQNVAKDPISDQFAHDMTAAFDKLTIPFSELRRVRQLYSVVAIAEGLENTAEHPDLRYLLEQYNVRAVPTDKTWPVLTSPGTIMELVGGVQLRALLRRLKDGDVTAMRDVVLRCRPRKNSLSWQLPLSSWQMSGRAEDGGQRGVEHSELERRFGQLGCNIFRESAVFSTSLPPTLGMTPRTETLNSLSNLSSVNIMRAGPSLQIIFGGTNDLHGVDMRMDVTDGQRRNDNSAALEQERSRTRHSRPTTNSLIWSPDQ